MNAGERGAAVVTGASGGIGRTIAERFAADGYTVIASGRDRAGLEGTVERIAQAGGRAELVVADVNEIAEVEALAARVSQGHGAASAIVACSGVAGPTAPLWEISPLDWDATISTNLRGTFLCLRYLLPDMVAAASGSVVLLGSTTGKRPMHGRTPYAAGKMALSGLVRSLALELAEYGIRANLLSPGPTNGERLRRVFEAQASLAGRSIEEIEVEFVSAIPQKRLVSPEEIAACAAFLSSEEASSITGQEIDVNGGWFMS